MHIHCQPTTAVSRLVRVMLSVLALISLVACGGNSGNASIEPAAVVPQVLATSTTLTAKSSKRGLAYGGQPAADMTTLSQAVTWWYNWSPAPEPGAASIYTARGVAFVPMVWGGTPTATQLLAQIPAGAQYLLGFNEPNFISQANKTPTQAAQLWPVLESVARSRNLLLGAPAVNYCGNCVSEGGVTFTDPVAYLDAFLAACQGCKIDYLPIHWYACDLPALQFYINRFRKYNKPIWLTEFACGDKPVDQITLAVQKTYMTDAVNFLENEPAVARYAWFSGRTTAIPNADLLGADGALTELGALYLSLPAAANAAVASIAPATTLQQLRPQAAVASSSENPWLTPNLAIDGNTATRWSSAFSNQQWLYLDFGRTVSISRVRINWEAAYAKSYQIQTSADARNWTTIRTVNGSGAGIVDLTALVGSGRYMRMNGLTRATPYGYSMFEITAWGI